MLSIAFTSMQVIGIAAIVFLVVITIIKFAQR
jgi:hypothetical protein